MVDAISERRYVARAGVPLAQAGGLPPVRGIEAQRAGFTAVNLEPSLAGALRPQVVNQWMLPYLAAMTPQYVETLLRGMLFGSHAAGMELFTVMIDTDPEISACVQEWTDGVLDKKVVYEPYHEEDEEPSPEAVEKSKVVSAALRNMRPDMTRDENDLRNTIKDILFARFHGISVLEIDWHDTYGNGDRYIKNIAQLGQVQCVRSTYWVHPTCYGLDQDYRLGLNASLVGRAREASREARTKKIGAYDKLVGHAKQDALVEFPPDKFLIGINKAKTGSMLAASCLRPLAWWWLASNFCGDWLLKYSELFGVPFRWAKLDAGAWSSQRTEIGQALQNMGANGFLMTPVGVELEFMDAAAAGGQSPQAFLFEFADRQKRKVILNQTMSGSSGTTGKGGGQAFGTVEEDVKSDCIDSGARYVEGVLNLQLVPAILNLNYGDGGDLEAPTIKLVDVEVGNLSDAQRDQVLAQMMDIPESYGHRKYGIPKPKPGEKILGKDIGAASRVASPLIDPGEDEEENDESDDSAEVQDKDEEQEDGEEAKGTGTEARAAVTAASVKPSVPERQSETFYEIIKPMLDRLKAIEAIEDAAARKAMLEKFLKDHSAIAEAMTHDDSLAKELSVMGISKFAEGLKTKPK